MLNSITALIISEGAFMLCILALVTMAYFHKETK